MCGRYTLYHHEDDLASLFEVETFPLTERYNIAPTQAVWVVRERVDGTHELDSMRWGLIPHWVKDPKEFKANLFNARAESAAEKPSFRDAMKRGRCLLPASGFYEWKQEGGGKQPYFIHRKDGAPLAFAGLYSHWGRGEDALLSCTILTTDANEDVRSLHNRMPLFLEPSDWERWLDPEEYDPAALEDLLQAPQEGLLESWPVGREVGDSRAEGPQLVTRV